MYKNICVLILFSFGLLNCGYTPMISKVNDQNFNIVNLDTEGDQQISSSIKRGLERYAKNQKTNKNFEIVINTNYEKITLVKDAKGNATDFKLVVNLKLTFVEKEENIEKIIELNESFTIKKNDNNYEQKDYERAIKNNMAQTLVNKIIFHLSKY